MGSQADYDAALEAKRAAFVIEYCKSEDVTRPGADHPTFGIDVSYFDGLQAMRYYALRKPEPNEGRKWWGNQIEVHGDEALRDRILADLQSREQALAALRVAADTLKAHDAGDPSTETGWASDDLLAAWLLVIAAIQSGEQR